MGIFGLGPPEIAVCLGLAAFVLGRAARARTAGPRPAPTAPPYAPRPRRPEKLTVMAKDFGKIAGELKDVPKEFKEGLDSVEPSSSKSLAAEKPAEEKTEA